MSFTADQLGGWEDNYDVKDYESCDNFEEPKVEVAVQSEALENIRKLCRVCSSKGLISIQSQIPNNFIQVQRRNHSDWQGSIGRMIEHISGEKVSSDDLLPQFICAHCLGYLQHAYEMRLKIVTNSANLRQAMELADTTSVPLETSQIDQTRITRREIEDTNEGLSEERHLFGTFRGSNVRITPNVNRYVNRAIEHNCPGCRKRVMSVKSLNAHMEICEISLLDCFFGQFRKIYSMRMQASLTTKEFVAHSIKLVINTHNKLMQIVKAKKLDVNAISTELPDDVIINQLTPPLPPLNNYKSYNQSPDNGYNSGNSNYNFMPR